MKLSIIIPCLNAADTIEVQLEELANQQLPELEVIVVDNGSSDNSIAVVQEYKKRLPKAIVYYRLQHISGTYRQAKNWAKAYIMLLSKYGQPIPKIFKLKSILGWRHLLIDVIKIRSKVQLFSWVRLLGWRVGKMQGCIKYL